MSARNRKRKPIASPAPPADPVSPRPPGEMRDEPAAWRRAGRLMALAAVLFSAWLLRSELTLRAPDLNDMVLHRMLVRSMIGAIQDGRDYLDPWVPNVALGYPVWHVYQPLPHLATALATLASGREVWVTSSFLLLLLLSLFPAAVFAGARMLGLGSLQSGAAAIVAALIDSSSRYGLELRSYVWSGSGLYTQAWAQLAMVLAIGCAWRALTRGRSTVFAGALLAITFLCHSVYGFTAVITTVLMFLFVPAALRRRAVVALMVMLTTAFVGIAFFLIPLLLDHEAVNRSRWELAWKWDSYGASEVLSLLFRGQLFDGGGVPLLTFAVVAGLVLCFWKRSANAMIGAGFVLWLLLYFGRATWGPLYSLVPMSGDLPQHRLIAGVHLFGILAAGVAIGAALQWVARTKGTAWLAFGLGTLLLLLTPAMLRQIELMRKDRLWKSETIQAYQRDRADLERIFATIRREPRGRVYAGLATNWGKETKVGSVPLYALVTAEMFESNSYLYHAMGVASDLMILFDETRSDHYRTFHVGWFVTTADHAMPAFLQKAGEYGRFAIYRSPDGGPIEVGTSFENRAAEPRDHYELSREWLDGNKAAVRVLWPADANVPADDSIAVLKSTWHPRWRPSVDGRAGKLLMVSPGFAAMAVPPGTRHIEFRFHPQPWKAPLALVSWLLIVAAAVLEWKGRVIPRVLSAGTTLVPRALR